MHTNSCSGPRLFVNICNIVIRNIVIVRVYICIVVYVNPDESIVFKESSVFSIPSKHGKFHIYQKHLPLTFL